MQSYEYKVVSAPRRSKRIRGVKGQADIFAKTIEDTIQQEAREGWEYLRADTIPSEEKRGLFSGRTEHLNTLLIFRRPTAARAAAPAPRAAADARREPVASPPFADAPLSLGTEERADDGAAPPLGAARS